jgi:hypothetical protein
VKETAKNWRCNQLQPFKPVFQCAGRLSDHSGTQSLSKSIYFFATGIKAVKFFVKLRISHIRIVIDKLWSMQFKTLVNDIIKPLNILYNINGVLHCTHFNGVLVLSRIHISYGIPSASTTIDSCTVARFEGHETFPTNLTKCGLSCHNLEYRTLFPWLCLSSWSGL